MALDLEFIGHRLSVLERAAIKNSLVKLRIQEKLPSVQFWGRVSAVACDYIIVQATIVAESITKQYYWSTDNGLNFAKLPPVDAFISSNLSKWNVLSLFSGNPSQLVKDPSKKKFNEDGEEIEDDEEPEEEPEAEAEEDGVEKKAPRERRITELERLAWSVERIENDTGLVPRGSYIMTPTGRIVRDLEFAGVSPVELRQLATYQLLRDPQLASTLMAIRKAGGSNTTAFLDDISSHRLQTQGPENAASPMVSPWSLQTDQSGATATLRSLAWPGFEYRLEQGSPAGRGAYFGTGLENQDLLWML